MTESVSTVPRPRAVGEVRAEFGEGPIWDAAAERVRWVDIPAGLVHTTDPTTGVTDTERFTGQVSAVWPALSGGTIVANGTTLIRVGRDGRRDIVARLPLASGRINDVGTDRDGRLWVGTMPARPVQAREGRLWLIDQKGVPAIVRDGMRLPNGIGIAPDDKRLYVVDTLDRCVWSIDPHATAAKAERVVEFDDGAIPDGLAVDEDGRLWIACHGIDEVRVFSPDGVRDHAFTVSARGVTSCAFGGLNSNAIFLTTAGAPHVDDAHPESGHLFASAVPVGGVPVTPVDDENWRTLP